MLNRKNNDRLEQLEEAITSLKRGNKKLSISKIAYKAGIARKTIYNNPPLKARCEQEIYLQEQGRTDSDGSEKKNKLSGYKLLEHRYNKAKALLQQEQEKNAKLLENNRQLVLDKDLLKVRIKMLQQKFERLNQDKIKPIK